MTVLRAARSLITSQMIASRPEDETWPNAVYFIRSVRLDSYAGHRWSPPSEMKEGILIDGAGHGIFYWKSGRYVLGFADPVDRDQ